MVNIKVVFADKGTSEVYFLSRVPCLGEIVFYAGTEAKVIEVIHMMKAEPNGQIVARILVK